MYERHGLTKHPLNTVHGTIRDRCNNPNSKAYPEYGGRGITLCEEWYSFKNFYDWSIANGYAPGLTIDRIDNDKGYNPSNCRWVNRSLQNLNKRTQKNNTSGVQGVWKDNFEGHWVAVLRYNRRKIGSKTFSSNKYGDVNAKIMAIRYRYNLELQLQLELTSQGIEYHISQGVVDAINLIEEGRYEEINISTNH